jgi:hypothetical protein
MPSTVPGAGCATTTSPAEAVVLSTRTAHSRGEGMIMHSTAAQPPPLPDNAHAPPIHPAVLFTRHRRSYFRWTPSSTRYRSLCPTGTVWNRHPRLASEMHCTIAHRLTSHIHILPVHQQNQQTRGFHQTHPSFVASKASYGEADRGRCHFSAAKLLLLAQCAADSSGMQQNLIRPHLATTSSGFRAAYLFNDGPEARADCTAASAASSLVLSV